MESISNDQVTTGSLILIDKNAYIKYLKTHEKTYKKAGVDVNRFKYFKLYGDKHLRYSLEYLEQTSIKEILERDRENQKRLVKINERV
ncbi:hydrolase [Bacillus thuringiensis]|uniref:hydrolase n=1 Tax=Bacillus thuringiensis TaxID=1428 RepID=UPI0035DF5015|nr:hydrolase [Bacillus cereus]